MKKFMADPVKFGIYGAAALLLLVTAAAGVVYRAWVFAAIFGAAAVAFVLYTIGYGTTLEISPDGLQKRRFPGTQGRHIPFSQIREVGVAGTNPFYAASGKSEKTGVIYIYFSEEKMDSEQRRMLAYRWPRSVSYLRYTRGRYEAVQRCWDREIVQYNTGSRVI